MRIVIAGLMVVLAGCSSSPAATAKPPAMTPFVPVFDVWAVRANFTDECQNSAEPDETFCVQVQIDEMSDEEDILHVPTTLDPGMKDRASVICDEIAVAHFDAEGRDLGYRFVVVRDMNGGNLVACSVHQR